MLIATNSSGSRRKANKKGGILFGLLKRLFGLLRRKKVFGLEQAEEVNRIIPNFDVATLQACLSALKVPNVVAKEINVEIKALLAAIINNEEVIKAIVNADQDDEKETEAEIAKIKELRAKRKSTNSDAVVLEEADITRRKIRIAALEAMARSFAVPEK